MYRDLLASLLIASAGSLALAAPTLNPKSATIPSAPLPSALSALDSIPFADAHERRAWSRHLAKRQVAVPNVVASPVVASPAVVAPVTATAAIVNTPFQAVAPTFVIAEPSSANPAPVAPVAATPAVQSVNTPLPAAASTSAAVVPLKNRPVASSSASVPDTPSDSSPDMASSASPSSSASASSSSAIAKSSASFVSQSLSATSSSQSASATSASDSSNGNIFSPSNHLFMVGILVIIGIIVFSILTVIYLVKRLAHSPRYADSRDYPDGFPRDFLDDKALSKRWSHTSQTGLLWEEGAKVPSSSTGKVEVKEVRGMERAMQGTAGREFGGRRGGAPLPPVKEEQAPTSRWTTFTSAPKPTPLAGRAASASLPVRPAPPFPPRPSSAVPLPHARVSSAPPTLPPKPAPFPPPSARQPNKLVRASTTAAPPSVVRDAHTLQKHRWSPKRESALRNEVV
ncbi:Proteophosphoglycan ppg4 [Rhodotorula toruloides ATCC 204091]|uniref:BY PROTMAP: gi/342319057/gb/EGU11009.1/ Proteophosphoglycan ppg4 [Rhodotorula glutinis ATCC 204091] n=1 Tax=Rhodotorula toruloides TaxID=5286 RepID=A0A0K3CQ57_RHOTO|nr:Proteophosphoglycan ppg4 [Rhodotorula toruloides ATCC 204091]KAK4330761.1 Proteophosphoglycan ppg4 [Rhodotorula toruloides]PRQ70620.1 hypothetical protein AAT19DRAFT_10777 [Rhodotorula toruloides]